MLTNVQFCVYIFFNWLWVSQFDESLAYFARLLSRVRELVSHLLLESLRRFCDILLTASFSRGGPLPVRAVISLVIRIALGRVSSLWLVSIREKLRLVRLFGLVICLTHL